MAGYTRTPGQAVPIQLADTVKLETDGLVIARSSGKGVLCRNDTGNEQMPWGIALNSTLSAAHYGYLSEPKVYHAGKDIGEIAVVRNGQVRIALAAASTRNADIEIGDWLAVSTTQAQAGKVDRFAYATAAANEAAVLAELLKRDRIVGMAEEKVEDDDADKTHILASIIIRGGIGP